MLNIKASLRINLQSKNNEENSISLIKTISVIEETTYTTLSNHIKLKNNFTEQDYITTLNSTEYTKIGNDLLEIYYNKRVFYSLRLLQQVLAMSTLPPIVNEILFYGSKSNEDTHIIFKKLETNFSKLKLLGLC